ncbi:MAG: SGNH/GDSL hydrolase family protein [Beijerinckiaceae bacterium]
MRPVVLLIYALLAGLSFLTAGNSALAQNEALQFILEQDRQRRLRAAQPRRVVRPSGPRIIEVPRRILPQSSVVIVRDTPDTVKVEPAIFVVVFGDAMAELLGVGIEDTLGDLPDVSVIRRSRSESGLVRADFYDWPKSVRDYLAGTPKINFAVMQVGVNDRQAIRDEAGQSHEPGSERWREMYGQRVEAVARAFSEKQIPLLWAGLPPMPFPNYSASIKEINEITRIHVGRAGGQFIDVWDSFADAQGKYSVSGADMNGQTTRLRAADGVHFSKSGARKAAHFVEIEIRRMIGTRAPTSVVALPSDPASVRPLPIELQPGGVERAIDIMVSGRAEAAPIVSVPVKPVAGPIIPLSQPVLAKGGVLATPASNSNIFLPGEQTLVTGRPQEAKPGRVDDFSWPPR